MIPKHFLYDGSREPVPEPIALTAGPLTMQFEPRTGLLRYIRIGDHEIVRAIYAAIRDHNWGTIPPHLINLQQEINTNSFRLTFDVECRQEPGVDYLWHGAITGEANGTVRYSFDGVARSGFARNRIGICVLHPITECAGQPCTVEHSDQPNPSDTTLDLRGAEEKGQFPRFIDPNQPFFDVRKISYTVAGATARLTFAGDEFEMEDQRNWTDASFKTYCTPQIRPKPVVVSPGSTVKQSVVLEVQPPARLVLPVLLGRPPQLSISTTRSIPLPPLGFCVERLGQALTPREIDRLRALRPAHLRVDLRLSAPDYPTLLEAAVAQSNALNAALHLAVIVSNEAEKELKALAELIRKTQPKVGLWLIFHRAEETTNPRWVAMARQILGGYNPSVLFAAGTLAFFTEINRNRPVADAAEFPCFSLNPQVHAFDNTTMVENLAGQENNLESAREFTPRALVVSPITVKIRSHEPDSAQTKGLLPVDVDPRQMSLFGAGWTLGSIARLATTGNAHSLTYYETVGWRGLMESEAGSPLPDLFPSLHGSVFPVYHVFADIAEFGASQIYPTHSSHPLLAEGLTLADGKGRRRILVANLSNKLQELKIKTGTCEATVRYLDERNAEHAMTHPEEFRREKGETISAAGGKLALNLLPYALATVDIAKA
jgi:hypothetical protein